MERHSPKKFDESTLLAYVEQTMSPEARVAFEAEVARDARLLASLRRMQADCEQLRAMPEEKVPAGLVTDVLATVERSMLLESDLVAPPIDMRRYRATHWQRYAAAAGFTLLLTGGGFMLFKTLLFDSRDDVFAPNSLVQGDPAELMPGGTESGEAEVVEPISPEVERVAQGDSESSTPGEIAAELAAFEAALLEAAEPATLAALDGSWPADLDLYANVVSADPATAFETIAASLRARGGDLIVNATLNVPANGDERGREHLAGMDPAASPVPTNPGVIPVPLPANTGARLIVNPDDRIPLVDQSRYAANGYQFTLLGTPSDILRVMRELGADRSMRISWSRPGAGRLLVDLVAPNLPPRTRWDHVMFWWADPAARFDEARSAVARASTEPIVRIPVRILASERR